MKALMRVVAFSGPAVAEYAPQVITGLTGILGRVCANPTNPVFNHFLFETIACLMRDTCNANPAAVPEFERMLFPPFEHVLSADVAEFLPYVFQLMAELLELRPAPAPGEHALTAAYQSLLPPLLTAEIWLRPGNVPALAMLMRAYLRRGAAFLAEKGHLVPLLGVWQNLLNTKNQEEFSFDILDALCEWAGLRTVCVGVGVQRLPAAVVPHVLPADMTSTTRDSHGLRCSGDIALVTLRG
jgi:exportin-2 (importin alpha re-exporter)